MYVLKLNDSQGVGLTGGNWAMELCPQTFLSLPLIFVPLCLASFDALSCCEPDEARLSRTKTVSHSKPFSHAPFSGVVPQCSDQQTTHFLESELWVKVSWGFELRSLFLHSKHIIQ